MIISFIQTLLFLINSRQIAYTSTYIITDNEVYNYYLILPLYFIPVSPKEVVQSLDNYSS